MKKPDKGQKNIGTHDVLQPCLGESGGYALSWRAPAGLPLRWSDFCCYVSALVAAAQDLKQMEQRQMGSENGGYPPEAIQKLRNMMINHRI